MVADGKQHLLSLSPDVSMTPGDIGIVSFTDINFDDVPDLAISASFGVGEPVPRLLDIRSEKRKVPFPRRLSAPQR